LVFVMREGDAPLDRKPTGTFTDVRKRAEP
jgi:hypothetical protein